MLRAIGVISAVAILVTSVTFAAIQSQATLTNSTISTGTAGLKLWDGDSYESVAPGFTVTNLVPGTPKEFPFYAQNSGDVPLALTVTVPGAPSASGFSGWENVKVVITDDEGHVTNTDMGALLAGPVAITTAEDPFSVGSTGDSNADVEGNFTISFDIAPASITGSSASVGGFNLDFVGAQTTEPLE